MRLDDTIDIFDRNYTNEEQITSDIVWVYGKSPGEVIEEKERRLTIIRDLEIISSVLSEQQKRILALTGAGFNTSQIEEIANVSSKNMKRDRRSIVKKLENEADEERIQYVAGEVVRLAATSKGRHSKLYKDLCDELDRRLAVREAMKRLFVNLTPPSSKLEADGGMSMPAYTFERAMAVGEGMREGIEEGKKVMKTIVKCRVPEYLKETFGDDCTCCTWCATCKRKKDVTGRRGFGWQGLEKEYNELYNNITTTH